jgi:Concanavalin A-like lectin/glucanases superfamily
VPESGTGHRQPSPSANSNDQRELKVFKRITECMTLKGSAAPLLGVVVVAVIWMASASSALASAGLVGQWRLDEGSGAHVADGSGYVNDGTVVGDITWVSGHEGTALSFAGVAGRVQIPNNSSLEPKSTVTVSAWFKRQGSPGDYKYIVAKGATGCIAASYGVYSGPNGGLQFYVSRGRGVVYARSPDAGTRVWDGNWHSVVGTFDGSMIRLFVDGVEVGSGTSYPGSLEYLLPESNDLFIGDYPGCQTHEFVGVIDDVMVWNRTLSTAEIKALMSTKSDGNGSTPTPNQGGQHPPGLPPAPSKPLGQKGSPPAIRLLKLSPSKMTIGRKGHLIPGKHATVAMISYIDTQAARSTLTILVSNPGARRGKGCVEPSAQKPDHRAMHCTDYLSLGSFSHADRAGRNRFRFAGFVGRKLPLGQYRLAVTPRAHGAVGRTVSVSFKVVR